MKFTTSVLRLEGTVQIEHKLEIMYCYSPGSRGHCDKYGAPEEPDEDPSIELQFVVDDNGNEFDLTPQEEEIIHNECWEDFASRQSDSPEPE